MAFKKGNKDGHGGHRKGAGRKPGWVKEKAESLIADAKVLEFLARVVQGKEYDYRATKDGKIIKVPASLHDRIDAGRELMDRGVGKAVQAVSNPDGSKLEGLVLVRSK